MNDQLNEKKTSNVPMILGIIGFVFGIPGVLCTSVCAGISSAAGSGSGSSFWLSISLIPTIAAFIFSFVSKSKGMLSGAIIIICAIVILISVIITFNWFWGLISFGCFLMSGILSIVYNK